MFSSRPIGRARFFFYSLATQFIELVGVLVVFSTTMGLANFAASEPGPGREQLALGAGMVALAMAAVRIGIASRRVRDADGSGWITASYGLLLVIVSVLTGFTLLVWTPETGGGGGLKILNLVATGLWFYILFLPAGKHRKDAAPRGDTFDEEGGSRSGLAALSDEALLEKAAQLRAAARGSAPAGPNQPRTASFGRRGLG